MCFIFFRDTPLLVVSKLSPCFTALFVFCVADQLSLGKFRIAVTVEVWDERLKVMPSTVENPKTVPGMFGARTILDGRTIRAYNGLGL